jgi:hypothetical protein
VDMVVSSLVLVCDGCGKGEVHDIASLEAFGAVVERVGRPNTMGVNW